MSSVASSRMVADNWERARAIYPIYLNLVHQFAPEIRACKELESEAPQPAPDVMQRAERWFREADNRLEVHHIRELLTQTELEPGILQSLIARHIGKEPKNESDRDKIDFLLVQYLAQSLPGNLAANEPTLQQVSEVLQPVLLGASASASNPEVEQCAQQLSECRSLREMLGHKILERGRALKTAAQEKPFDAASLVPFARFSFLLRRSSIRLLHEEIGLLEKNLDQLDSQGTTSVDCSSAGLDSQSISELRWMCQEWKSYFRGKYSQNQWFSDVVRVGQCVEQALAPSAAAPIAPSPEISAADFTASAPQPSVKESQVPPPAQGRATVAIEPAEPPKTAVLEARPTASIEPPPRKTAVIESRPTVSLDARPAPDAKRTTAAIAPPAAPTATVPTVAIPAPAAASATSGRQDLPVESYINEIVGQIKSIKNVRASSVTAIKVGGVRLMLSSGEADAFLKPAEGSAVIQHAVAVRALLLAAIEDPAAHDVAAAVKLAEAKMAQLEAPIAEATKNEDTDRMVNLTACVRALQKALDKAKAAKSK